MDLVQVDDIDLEAAQAVFAFAAEGIALQVLNDLAISIPGALALGEYIGFVGAAFEGARDHFLGMAESVHGGGVDPVDAVVQGGVNGGNGLVIVLGTPGEGPSGATHCPGAYADARQFQIAVSEPSFFHVSTIS